jgi:hypothetical protein
MLSAARKFFTLALALLAMVVLSACDNTARYTVKVYGQGNVIAEYTASSLSIDGGGIATFTLTEGNRKGAVSRGYSMHRTDLTAASNSPLVYKATLYSGGKAVETFEASAINGGRDSVSLQINGSERAVFNGTYMVQHIGANIQGNPDSARYKVTLFNDGVSLGTWFADSYSSNRSNGLVLKINGIDNALTIGGQYTIEQFR